MALRTPNSGSLLDKLAEGSRFGALNSLSEKSSAKHAYVALVPRGTDIAESLMTLAISPNQNLIASMENENLKLFPFTDKWDQIFFTMLGDPVEQPKEMALPKGTLALAFSGLIELTKAGIASDDSSALSPSDLTVVDTFMTAAVARHGRCKTILTPAGEPTFRPDDIASPVGVELTHTVHLKHGDGAGGCGTPV